MNSNAIKLVLLACVAIGLGYLLFIKEPEAPKIITTYNNLPSPASKTPEPQNKQNAQDTITVTAETQPAEESIASKAESTEVSTNIAAVAPAKTTSIVDKIDLKELKVQYLDPNTPCPSKHLSCFAEPGGMIIDASCPTYKPVWAYVSLDKGVSWVQVGCFATELDATRAIEKAKQSGTASQANTMVAGKLKPAEKPMEKTGVVTNPASISSISTNTLTNSAAPSEQKPQEKTSETATNTKPTPTVAESKLPEVKNEVKTALKEEKSNHAVAQPAHEPEKPTVSEPTPIKNEKSDKTKSEDLTVNFRTAFGLVSVEKRTYPNLEMKHKAIKMWDNGQRLLEPDGSINDKYMVKPSDSNVIPGVQ